MARKIKGTFKSVLEKLGYSRKASNEVWKWYASPKKGSRAASSDFLKLYNSIYEEGPAIRYRDPERWRQP